MWEGEEMSDDKFCFINGEKYELDDLKEAVRERDRLKTIVFKIMSTLADIRMVTGIGVCKHEEMAGLIAEKMKGVKLWG